MLRDDDLVAALRATGAAPASGSHLPGGGTDLRIGVDSVGDDAEMVAHHEAAHLELNYVTGFGLILRAVGSQLQAAPDERAERQLAGLVDLCRDTHEIFATTTGVWRSRAPFDAALAAYPAYHRYLDAGRALAGSLREGSFAAHTAMMCACWAAMQPPVGQLLAQHRVDEITADLIPESWRPDRRIEVLLQARFDPATVDVALPASWRDEELRAADLEVSRLHETFVAVASTYYYEFGAILDDAGLPTYAFDGHKSDPALGAWLQANPAPRSEVIHFRPSADGNDGFGPSRCPTASGSSSTLVGGSSRATSETFRTTAAGAASDMTASCRAARTTRAFWSSSGRCARCSSSTASMTSPPPCCVRPRPTGSSPPSAPTSCSIPANR